MEDALTKIEHSHPVDFRRIQRRVRRVTPAIDEQGCPARKLQTGTLGAYGVKTKNIYLREDAHVVESGRFDAQQTLDLWTNVITHELGHACARKRDCRFRITVKDVSLPWEDELIADRYASKWGFGKLIDEFADFFPYPKRDSPFTVTGSDGSPTTIRIDENLEWSFEWEESGS